VKLSKLVDLVPGHIVLDGDPATRPPKGHTPLNFRPIGLSVVAKWLDGSRCHLEKRPLNGGCICVITWRYLTEIALCYVNVPAFKRHSARCQVSL